VILTTNLPFMPPKFRQSNKDPMSNLWRTTLSQIPSLFGQLVYLSSLRSINTGKYQHFGFGKRFSDREAHRTLQQSHEETFAHWLCCSLTEKTVDLKLYLSGLKIPQSVVLTRAIASCLRPIASEALMLIFVPAALFVLKSIFQQCVWSV